MPDSVYASEFGASSATQAAKVPGAAVRHTVSVRVTHWVVALSFLALLVTGIEIVISHPRFYWGEEGNVNIPPLFSIPIPASRASVPTGFNYTLPDQNGWSRSLHFQTAWVVVAAGLWYVLAGLLSGHFRRNLLPSCADLSPAKLAKVFVNHLRFRFEGDPHTYNPLQRLAYLLVVIVAFPLIIWTGLAMSPAVTSTFPFLVNVLGGHQSARTLHFIDTLFLALFLVVHVLMVCVTGFRNRMSGMITGKSVEKS
ncbi:MAG TPA: cytochrome b/b6 domain-containing protein [Verrucomicrobiae bacterium]|jgi:thiosulfate reductase cytochrome b subunit|nr:cytochrome b/b6 domain-containing protein [Verrucomicrobiae bacterium]